MQHEPVDLDAIKSRLLDAGYPDPESRPPSVVIRDVSEEGQRARAELRDHIIDDVWALLKEVAALRERLGP